MKIERVFSTTIELSLEDIITSVIKEKIDNKVFTYYSNLINNHNTSSNKGDVTIC